jgi:hypothetical protein
VTTHVTSELTDNDLGAWYVPAVSVIAGHNDERGPTEDALETALEIHQERHKRAELSYAPDPAPNDPPSPAGRNQTHPSAPIVRRSARRRAREGGQFQRIVRNVGATPVRAPRELRGRYPVLRLGKKIGLGKKRLARTSHPASLEFPKQYPKRTGQGNAGAK